MSFELTNPISYNCACERKDLVKRTYSNGSIHYVYQCDACGKTTNAIPHEEALKILNGTEPKLYDATLWKRFLNKVR